MWYLYVLRCENDALYTGISTDVQRRFETHRAGKGARYTRMHRPVAIEGAWRYPDQATAAQAEYAFKQLPRATKIAFLQGRWPFGNAPFAFDLLGDELAHHFCPRCGGQLRVQATPHGAVQHCQVCGRNHYRNAKPCAGALILRAGQVLLTRRAQEPYQGYWDIPGGFLEAEELPAVGAIREVREELGLDVQLVDFLGFYMDTYEFQSERYPILNIYFIAETAGAPQLSEEIDGWQWFPVGVIPEQLGFHHEHQVLMDLEQWVDGDGGTAWAQAGGH